MPHILSLDSEPEILNLLHTIFERAGYEHTSTMDNQEALRLLQHGGIDLLTQNIMRCGTNGCEFYQYMQSDQALRQIPVLIISSVDPLTLPDRCFQLIADLYPQRYVAMPFRRAQLLATVEDALKRP